MRSCGLGGDGITNRRVGVNKMSYLEQNNIGSFLLNLSKNCTCRSERSARVFVGVFKIFVFGRIIIFEFIISQIGRELQYKGHYFRLIVVNTQTFCLMKGVTKHFI